MHSSAPSSEPVRRHLRSPKGNVRASKAVDVELEKGWTQRSVPECFAEHAAGRHDDRVAISGAGGDLRYGDLNRLSDRVARAVIARGGRRTEPVALLLEHEAPVPAAMLGVLKAGSFFVPLDPSYPSERNRYVLKDAEAAILITNGRNLPLAESLGVGARQILDLDDIASTGPTDYRAPRSSPDDLAYLLYTSGSTGAPKGVMRTHRGLLHNVRRSTHTRQMSAADRVALLFSYSFSAAVGNAFTTLLNGATLVPFDLRAQGAVRLAEWLIERRITKFHTVPTVFRHLTDILDPAQRFHDLRLIQLGGESMFAKDVERFKRHFERGTILLVGMGTSESGHVFEVGIDHDTEIPTEILPVGYPVDDGEICLLDAEHNPVASGGVGEIAVRGDFLSPGYWRRPELTASKFLPDARGGNRRTYLTGDLGRMLPDGCVFHLGRNDGRLRIRGQSVELPEVEAAILGLQGVREVAAVADERRHGSPRVVAYVVPSGARTAGELHRALSQTLPPYMVPSVIKVVDALPLLPNGKVDRQALREAAVDPGADRSIEEPRTETERTLASIWSAVLDQERVGVHDNFFELGGDSLLTMSLFVRVEEVFGVRLPPAALLHAPTVGELAAVLDRESRATPVPSLVALQPHGSRPPFFWVHGENSNAFLPRLLGPDQPLYALLEQGRDGTRFRHRSVEEIAAYYLEGVQRVQRAGPYLLGGFCFGGILAFEMAQQLRRQDQEVGLLVMVDPHYGTTRPVEPERLPARASRHLRAMVPLPVRAKAAYVLTRVLELPWRWLPKRETVVCVLHELAGRPVPAELRFQYIKDRHGQAKRRYVPQPYLGRVVALRSDDSTFDPTPTWGRLASGGLDVRLVRGPHEMLVNEESHIGDLAKELQKCLDRALDRST